MLSIHYSLIILYFDAIQSERLVASLNKSQTHGTTETDNKAAHSPFDIQSEVPLIYQAQLDYNSLFLYSIPVASTWSTGHPLTKTLVLLQFLNLRQLVGLLGRGISPSQGRYLT
jgi:hypothetical protein